MSARLSYSNLGELSRQKLLRVAESSDTLRRAVLIHNIMRSTASLPPSPTSSDYNEYYPQQAPSSSHHYHPYDDHDTEDVHDVEEPSAEEERDYIEAATVQESNDLFVFPRMSAASQERDWLDSILDDLDRDVHVSVVPVDEFDQPPILAAEEPLFAPPSQCTSPPPSSSPHSSPPLRPTSPRCNISNIPIPQNNLKYQNPHLSPPASPPELDVDTIDSDDDDDDDSDEDDYSDVRTPSASTEFTPSDNYFFSHLPFHHHHHQRHERQERRCRPLL